MARMRILVALLLVVATCGVGYKFVGHHEASSAFETLYMHLMPSPLIYPEDGHDTEDGHAGALGESEHGEHAGEHPDYILAIPLPGFLAFFATNGADVGHGADPVAIFSNLQLFQLLSVLLIVVLMSGVPNHLRTGKGDTMTRLFAGFALWVRDDVVFPVMGKELGGKFLPYFLFVFFFIMFMNVLGLVPMSSTATASIFVTAGLALTTLMAMIGCGMIIQGPIAFWKNLVPHVPLAIWPLMFAVEVFGLFVKPIALMIRLFANMTGGHLVVLSFMGLIFAMGSLTPAAGYASAPVAVGFAVFIMIIEAFVALLQAYIFTQLSVIFVHASVHPEH